LLSAILEKQQSTPTLSWWIAENSANNLGKFYKPTMSRSALAVGHLGKEAQHAHPLLVDGGKFSQQGQ
jgi:hypothetical protein